jgi:translation initiation factor 2-alpha kinase 4
MAPHKTPKKNAQQDATSPIEETLPVRPPMVSQPSETYEKAQEDEREVLKAVFMDDYEESEATGAWSVSRKIWPNTRP